MTMSDSTVTTCYRHPDRVTGLSCTTCGKPICVECSHDASVGQKCPDCAAPEPGARVVQARRSTGRPSFQTAPATFTILGITLAIFALGFLSFDLDATFKQFLSFVRPGGAIIAGEFVEPDIYRSYTVVLVHGSLMHVGFNMYALYLFGPRLEQQVGTAAFTSLYLASAAVGSLTALIFGPSQGWAVGASGAIFGLFGAWIFVAWKMRSSPGGRQMFNTLGVLLAINLALPLFVPGIEWLAHVGGMVAGLGIAYLWSVFAVGRPNARNIRLLIASAVNVVAIVGSAIVLF